MSAEQALDLMIWLLGGGLALLVLIVGMYVVLERPAEPPPTPQRGPWGRP